MSPGRFISPALLDSTALKKRELSFLTGRGVGKMRRVKFFLFLFFFRGKKDSEVFPLF